MKLSLVFGAAALGIGLLACGAAAPQDAGQDEQDATGKVKGVTKADREKYLAEAQIWSADDFAKLADKDLLVGPTGDGAFNATRGADGSVTFPEITCKFVEPSRPHELGGRSPKFQCGACADGCTATATLKVKFGKDADANGELYGEVISTRLMWALGFKVDDVYPVRVTCKNCPSDPWDIYDNFKPNQGDRADRVFAAAVIERKNPGPKIEESTWPQDQDSEGFGFSEVDAIRQKTPGLGAPDVHWDAFKLLAAFIKHTDNKAANQRLVCDPAGVTSDGKCTAPFLMMQDVGSTFGGGAGFLGIINDGSKARLKNWTDASVWKDLKDCQAALSSRMTMHDPKVSEAGRAFLVGLLNQLTEDQLRDIFTASRIVERNEQIQGEDGNDRPVTVDDWVKEFVAKRAELAKSCGG